MPRWGMGGKERRADGFVTSAQKKKGTEAPFSVRLRDIAATLSKRAPSA